MARTRPAAGGGVTVEVAVDRLTGWVNRFAGRNDGITGIEATADTVLLRAADGTVAEVAVPLPPMSVGDREPLEALIDHVRGLGAVGLIAFRAGAHSVGVARGGVVVSSKTARTYVQGRTAAGGWSQQRYARRRGNQLTSAVDDAVAVAARVLVPVVTSLDALAVAGDRTTLDRVLADPRLAALADLPRRMFGDIPEPRRSVLDDLAERVTTVHITIRPSTTAATGADRDR